MKNKVLRVMGIILLVVINLLLVGLLFCPIVLEVLVYNNIINMSSQIAFLIAMVLTIVLVPRLAQCIANNFRAMIDGLGSGLGTFLCSFAVGFPIGFLSTILF